MGTFITFVTFFHHSLDITVFYIYTVEIVVTIRGGSSMKEYAVEKERHVPDKSPKQSLYPDLPPWH
jgi:hypothetical protein